MSTFGERIKQIREHHGLTQAEFANGLQVDQSYLSYIENDRKKPSEKVIRALHFNYKVNTEWLEYGTGNMLREGEIISARKVRVLNDWEFTENILLAVLENVSKHDDSYTPKEQARLVIAFLKYFADADIEINAKEIQKQVSAAYGIVSKTIKG